jgi:hypothetical protein
VTKTFSFCRYARTASCLQGCVRTGGSQQKGPITRSTQKVKTKIKEGRLVGGGREKQNKKPVALKRAIYQGQGQMVENVKEKKNR